MELSSATERRREWPIIMYIVAYGDGVDQELHKHSLLVAAVLSCILYDYR